MIQDPNTQITLSDPRIAQINRMVHAATEMGFGVVQEIAEQTVKRKPGCTVKEFTKILDQYLENQKAQANNVG